MWFQIKANPTLMSVQNILQASVISVISDQGVDNTKICVGWHKSQLYYFTILYLFLLLTGV